MRFNDDSQWLYKAPQPMQISIRRNVMNIRDKPCLFVKVCMHDGVIMCVYFLLNSISFSLAMSLNIVRSLQDTLVSQKQLDDKISTIDALLARHCALAQTIFKKVLSHGIILQC